MNIKTIGMSFVALCSLEQSIWSAEPPPATASWERTVYVKNATEYSVRISVSTEFPSSIALEPGQIIEFPAQYVPTIKASTYGKVSQYLIGQNADRNIAEELSKYQTNGSNEYLVTIGYEKDDSGFSVFRIAQYLFTLGKWTIDFKPIDSHKDLEGYHVINPCSESLYTVIKQLSDTTPEQIARDAALIWSMFPRASCKITAKEKIYPFNILGLDIGGSTPSDPQLRNWGNFIAASLRKKYNSIENMAIWNAVNMIIADSIESFRSKNYYQDRDLDYPVTLLHMRGQEVSKEPMLPPVILQQLKERIKADSEAAALLEQLEMVTRMRGWEIVKNIPQAPPPPPPNSPVAVQKPFQERELAKYLSMLEQTPPEGQGLIDKVATGVFAKIDGAGLEPQSAIRLKYSTLEKLRLIEQGKHAVQNLVKINEFMSPAMIRLAQWEANPSLAIQNWISLLARAERQKASDYSHMAEGDLQRVMQIESVPNYQELLIAHLRQQFQKFAREEGADQ